MPNLYSFASNEDATMGYADGFANVSLIYDLIHQTGIRQRFLLYHPYTGFYANTMKCME